MLVSKEYSAIFYGDSFEIGSLIFFPSDTSLPFEVRGFQDGVYSLLTTYNANATFDPVETYIGKTFSVLISQCCLSAVEIAEKISTKAVLIEIKTL